MFSFPTLEGTQANKDLTARKTRSQDLPRLATTVTAKCIEYERAALHSLIPLLVGDVNKLEE